MREIKLEKNLAVRLPEWTNCVVEIADVGQWSFWGALIDIKTNEVISPMAIFNMNEDWRIALDAATIFKILE